MRPRWKYFTSATHHHLSNNTTIHMILPAAGNQSSLLFTGRPKVM